MSQTIISLVIHWISVSKITWQHIVACFFKAWEASQPDHSKNKLYRQEYLTLLKCYSFCQSSSHTLLFFPEVHLLSELYFFIGIVRFLAYLNRVELMIFWTSCHFRKVEFKELQRHCFVLGFGLPCHFRVEKAQGEI